MSGGTRRRWAWLVAIPLAGLAWLLVAPGGGDPAAWTPPSSPGTSGAYAANQALSAVERIALGGAHGPEDVAFGTDGALYTGVSDGRLLRVRPGGAAETFATTGGRPLGLRFGPDGRLFVADAQRGLLAVAPEGRVEVLATEHAGLRFGLTDDLDIAADGTVYFTDASSRLGFGQSIQDVVEQRPTGRLLTWRPGEGTRLLHDGLYFANGVALAPDESYVLVVETARYRLQRCWLRGGGSGSCEVFADNLPGFPDGVGGDGHGTFWVALVSPRNALLDRLHPYPVLKTALLRLPDAVRPGPRPYGFVLGLDEQGRVVHNLQDPTGSSYAFVTNVVEHGGSLYLGSLELDAVGRVPRPR